MRGLSRRAQIYIWSVLGLGVFLLLWQGIGLWNLREQSIWFTWMIFTGLAAFSQLFKVTAPKHQNYVISSAFVFAAILLLQPGQVALLIVLASLPEWIRFRYPWYIQSFNIAADILTALLAKSIYLLSIGGAALLSTKGVASAVAAAAVFTLVNHILVAVVLYLARGVSLQESRTLEVGNLLTDFVLLGVGGSVAILWNLNSWLIIPASSPLLPIYRFLLVATAERG